MHYQFIKPSRVLSPFVKSYWILEIDKKPLHRVKQRIYSHACVELNLYYKARFELYTKTGKKILQPRVVISGQKKHYVDVSPTGNVGILSVIFHPHAAGLFFNLPINELTDQNLTLSELDKKSGLALEEQIQNAASNTKRISIVEQYLYNKIIENKLYDFKRINAGIQLINNKFGQTEVNSLSEMACLSLKQYERKFSAFVGMPPKRFLRTIRFQSAIYRKQLDNSISLTQLALDCGYYDQAHFTNEFKTFTGMLPKEFFKNENVLSDYFLQP